MYTFLLESCLTAEDEVLGFTRFFFQTAVFRSRTCGYISLHIAHVVHGQNAKKSWTFLVSVEHNNDTERLISTWQCIWKIKAWFSCKWGTPKEISTWNKLECFISWNHEVKQKVTHDCLIQICAHRIFSQYLTCEYMFDSWHHEGNLSGWSWITIIPPARDD